MTLKPLKNVSKLWRKNRCKKGLLTEEQLRCLEKATLEKGAHGEIKTEHPGYLGAQDTYANLYTEKTTITSAHALNSDILPWFQEHDIPLLRILTDRGTEFCGKIEEHAYQLFLALENIDHSKTKARSLQTNGICERFHRTMKEEFYDITFRKKLYHSLEELQHDVNNWLKEYNELRPHSGKYCYGNTPMQTFNESKKLALEKQLDNKFEVLENQDDQTVLIELDSSSTPTKLSIAIEYTVRSSLQFYT